MEADAGWYNTEKMEFSSRTSTISDYVLSHGHQFNVDTQFPVSFLANSASVQSHATHFRAQSKSFFPSNFSKCFYFFLIPTLKVHNAAFLWNISSGWLRRFNDHWRHVDSAIFIDNFLPRSLISHDSTCEVRYYN